MLRSMAVGVRLVSTSLFGKTRSFGAKACSPPRYGCTERHRKQGVERFIFGDAILAQMKNTSNRLNNGERPIGGLLAQAWKFLALLLVIFISDPVFGDKRTETNSPPSQELKRHRAAILEIESLIEKLDKFRAQLEGIRKAPDRYPEYDLRELATQERGYAKQIKAYRIKLEDLKKNAPEELFERPENQVAEDRLIKVEGDRPKARKRKRRVGVSGLGSGVFDDVQLAPMQSNLTYDEFKTQLETISKDLNFKFQQLGGAASSGGATSNGSGKKGFQSQTQKQPTTNVRKQPQSR